jgi:short-subunit dehydrogenase
MTQSRGHGDRQTALVTGASSGIGAALATLFARDRYELVLVARSEEALNRTAEALRSRHGIAATVLATDLARPAAAQQIFDELRGRGIGVDVLVNNAGFATFGRFDEIPTEQDLELLQVNVVALTHLTKLFLPGMVARRRGRILNVASTAGFQPGPLMAVYYASKAYVLSLSEALANELQGTSVTVTALCPGPTTTGFQKRAAMEDSKLVAGRRLMSAEAVAKAGYKGMQQGDVIVVPGLQNRVLAEAVRLLPRRLVTRIVRNAQERRTA